MNLSKLVIGCVLALMFVDPREATAKEPPVRVGSFSFRGAFKERAKGQPLIAPPEDLSAYLSNRETSDSAKSNAIIATSAVSVITPADQLVILELIKSPRIGDSLRLDGMLCLAMCCDESSIEDGRDIYEELTVVAQSVSDLECRIDACKVLILLNRSSTAMSFWMSTTLSAQISEKMLITSLDALTGCMQPDGPVAMEEVVLWMRILANHRSALPSTRESILRNIYLVLDFMEENNSVLNAQLQGLAESMLDPGITTMEGKELAISIMPSGLPVSSEALSAICDISDNPDVPASTQEVARKYLQKREESSKAE